MTESYSIVVSIIISIYLMFIAPLNSMMNENRKIEQMYIVNEITYFVENIRNTGKITSDMFIGLENRLSSLTNLYELEITHYINIYNEDKSQILYFEECNYLWEIKEELEKNEVYDLKRNEYIKVIVKSDEKMIGSYGGSIKS